MAAHVALVEEVVDVCSLLAASKDDVETLSILEQWKNQLETVSQFAASPELQATVDAIFSHTPSDTPSEKNSSKVCLLLIAWRSCAPSTLSHR